MANKKPAEVRAMAAAMLQSGQTKTYISKTLGIDVSTVRKIEKEAREGVVVASDTLDLSIIRNTMTQALLEKVEPIIAGITQDKIDEGKVHQLALAAKLLSDSGRNWAQIGREEARVQINVANLTTSIED